MESTCPEVGRINLIEKRLAMLDGNGTDKRGGRVGRLEDMVYWAFGVLILTMISSIGTLALQVMKH